MSHLIPTDQLNRPYFLSDYIRSDDVFMNEIIITTSEIIEMEYRQDWWTYDMMPEIAVAMDELLEDRIPSVAEVHAMIKRKLDEFSERAGGGA